MNVNRKNNENLTRKLLEHDYFLELTELRNIFDFWEYILETPSKLNHNNYISDTTYYITSLATPSHKFVYTNSCKPGYKLTLVPASLVITSTIVRLT